MRILQICTQMESGGAQRIAVTLANEFRSRGHRVNTVFIYEKTPAYSGEAGVITIFKRRPSLLGRLSLPFRLMQVMRAVRPDVVVTHTYYANVLGHLVARLAGIRSRIAVAHSTLTRYPRAVRIADLILGACGFYSHHVFVSRAAAAASVRYPKSYQHRIRIIYNGVRLADHGAVDVVGVRRKWGIPSKAPLLINVGRLSPVKNQAAILRAAVEIPEAHVVIAGTGEVREELRTLAKDLGIASRTHLIGETANDEIQQLLHAADVFVFPSFFEAMPVAVLEAMAAGLPIVGSDIPPMREVVGEAGILVPADDPNALAASIRSVLDDRCRAEALGESASIRARLFSLDQMVDDYERLFN